MQLSINIIGRFRNPSAAYSNEVMTRVDCRESKFEEESNFTDEMRN